MPYGIRTYSHNDIQAWKEDVGKIPANIATCQADIDKIETDITTLNLKTLPYIESLDAINQDIQAITARIHVLTLPAEIKTLNEKITEQNRKIEVKTAELDRIVNQLNPIEQELAMVEAAIQYHQTQQTINALMQELQPNQYALTTATSRLQSLESQERSLRDQIAALESSLGSLTIHRAIDTTIHIAEHSGHHHYDGYTSSASGYHSSHHHYPHHDHWHDHHLIDDVTRNMQIQSIQHDISRLTIERNRVSTEANAVRQEVQRLHSSITRLEAELASNQQRLAKFTYQAGSDIHRTLFQLQTEQQSLITQKLPLYNQQRDAQQAIASMNAIKMDLSRDCGNKEATYRQALHHQEPYLTTDTTNPLNVLLNQQNTEKERLLGEKKPLDNAIKKNNNLLAQQNKQLDTLKALQQQHDNNQYLHQLVYQNQHAYNTLKLSIMKEIASFEDKHPANQPFLTRATLLALPQHMMTIDQLPLDNKHEILCGMLWNSVQQNFNDAIFQPYLINMLGKEALDQNESKRAFADISMQCPALADITKERLFACEKQHYLTTLNALRHDLSRLPNDDSKKIKQLYRAAAKVANTINRECEQAFKRQDNTFDYKLHTTLLENTTSLLSQPGNEALLQRQRFLASQNHHGQPSLAKKIIGAVIIFTGVALSCVSAGLAITSFGISSPISIAGMATGVALSTAGAGLFFHGRQKGLSKALACFAKKANMAEPMPAIKAPYPPPQHTDITSTFYPAPSAPLLT